MIPLNLKHKNGKIYITWESIFWIGVVTAVGTVVGGYVLSEWVQPWLDARLNGNASTTSDPSIT